MNKKLAIRIVVALAVIMVANIPIVSFYISLLSGERPLYSAPFKLTSGLGGFSSDSTYYDNPDSAVKAFVRYRKLHPQDSTLYRNYPIINPLKFWHWREYVSEEVYRIPRR